MLLINAGKLLLFFTFSFADYRHDSAIQTSLIALAAPKVHSFTFHLQNP